TVRRRIAQGRRMLSSAYRGARNFVVRGVRGLKERAVHFFRERIRPLPRRIRDFLAERWQRLRERLTGQRTNHPPEARNRAQHEQYKRQLRRQMERPHAHDANLQDLINRNYREGAQVGSGSTADAIRHERATGEAVGGRFHTQKGEDTIRELERWLRNNPLNDRAIRNGEEFRRRLHDRQVAENILLDIRDALE
ncbi:MAG: hypothetical protein GY799_21550, partial [Desulfobulbaceae bacterium]|nr:hypothetical protein [Desulfobulbaceae bacterium]